MNSSGALPVRLASFILMRVADLTPGQLVLLLIAVASMVRVGFAASTGLGVDESYWVSLSRFPSLSYIDDAPMQAWIAAAASWLFASEAALPLRLPFIALFAGSSWLMYRLTVPFFGERAGLWAVVALNLAPVFTLAHASWILPDGALIFFELATANVLARILFQAADPKRHILSWLAAGALGGLAMLSKYHGMFLFLGTLLFLLTVPHQRRWLLTPGPWLGAAAALAVFSPVIVWNLQHDWAGLTFQLDRIATAVANDAALRTDRSGPAAPAVSTGTLRMVGGTVLFLGWLIVPLTLVLIRALLRGPAHPASWFLAALAVGPIAVFGSVNLWANQHFPHWPMPGWLFVFPLLGAAWTALEVRHPTTARLSMGAWTVIMLAALGSLVLHIRLGEPSFAALRLPIRGDPTVDLKDWNELRTALAQRDLMKDATPAVAAADWMDAAKVAYAIGPNIPVVCVCRVPQHFPYVHKPAEFVGRNMIVVGNRLSARRLQWLARHFDRLEPVGSVPLYRGSVPIKTLDLYRGINFSVSGSKLLTGPQLDVLNPQWSGGIGRSNDEPYCQQKGQQLEEQGCWPD